MLRRGLALIIIALGLCSSGCYGGRWNNPCCCQPQCCGTSSAVLGSTAYYNDPAETPTLAKKEEADSEAPAQAKKGGLSEMRRK